jgi:hypothetical protein
MEICDIAILAGNTINSTPRTGEILKMSKHRYIKRMHIVYSLLVLDKVW